MTEIPQDVQTELDRRLDLYEEDLTEGLDKHFKKLARDHLPGRHNQKTHGHGHGGSGAGGSSVPPEAMERHGAVIKSTMSFAGTGATATQPVRDLDDLYAKAKEAEPIFKSHVEQTARATGGRSAYTPPEYAEPGTTLKSRASAERKLKTELNDDPTQLKDVMRATVIYEKVADARVGAAEFIANNRGSLVRVKDRIADTQGGGYRDILVNYRVPGGLIAEVQFNSMEMINAKMGEGHKVYERLRTMDPKTASPKVIAELRRKELEIYDSAYKKDGNGSWKGE